MKYCTSTIFSALFFLAGSAASDESLRILQNSDAVKFLVTLTSNGGNVYDTNIKFIANPQDEVFTRVFVVGNYRNNLLNIDASLQTNKFDPSNLSCPVDNVGVSYTHDDTMTRIKIFRGLLNGSCRFYAADSSGRIKVRGTAVFIVVGEYPSFAPTISPSHAPTNMPTIAPSHFPTDQPTIQPTIQPSHMPTFTPTDMPTFVPTIQPSHTPTFAPTDMPTVVPTIQPSHMPTFAPTGAGTYTLTLTFGTGEVYTMKAQFINNNFIMVEAIVYTCPNNQNTIEYCQANGYCSDTSSCDVNNSEVMNVLEQGHTIYGQYKTDNVHMPTTRNCPITANGIGINLFSLTAGISTSVNVYLNSDGCQFGDETQRLGKANFELVTGTI